MAAGIPDQYKDLLTEKVAFANLATLMPDGSPQVTPVWFEFKDGMIRINTAQGRRKVRNLDANPKLAMAILDPTNPYRYLQIRGHVIRRTQEGADAHIDALAKRYLNQDKYPLRTPGEVRVIYEIAIDSCHGNG
ncbi:MAG: PPOX class F420-dependent oxidoreductase [Candidatus Binataceae bacterium]